MSLLVENRALLDAFRRGEPEALTQVYRECAEDVARFLSRGFSFSAQGSPCRFEGYRSRFDLEDMLQEVFTRAFSEKARLAYDGLSPFKPYLFTIARNAVIDEYRAKRRANLVFTVSDPNSPEPIAEPLESGVDVLEGDVAPTGDPGRDLENAELATLMHTFRDGLSPEDKQIFRLRFEEGKTLEEVESLTGRSPSKVKTAERKLRMRVVDLIWSSGYLDDYRLDQPNGWLAKLLNALELRKREERL